jgi:Flp pilus assembly protein TadD
MPRGPSGTVADWRRCPWCCITDKPDADTQEGVASITTQNASVPYYPSDEPLRLGREHFNRGNFGIAEQYFRDPVEKAPKDGSAWIGLAASYV